MSKQTHGEGLQLARLMMVLASFAPLFILWAIRGAQGFPGYAFPIICIVAAVVPNLILGLRIAIARGRNDRRELMIGRSEDHRDHLLVYLLAMLLPFYADQLADRRALVAALFALAVIVFLFWRLNLHYANVLFALFGYRLFMIYPPVDGNRFTGPGGQVLITRRVALDAGERVDAYRLTDTVYLEVGV